MKKFLSKYKYDMLSFFIPLSILCLVFICLFILVPNGNSILLSDMEIQYNSLFTYFKNHIFEIFSFEKGLGSGMIGTFAYYLSSPFNFIALLFPSNKMDIALLLILILKISFSGFTMYEFLKKTSSLTQKEKLVYFLIFSTSYALMSYHVAYFFNIMWLDATMILPIVILGIHRLFEKKYSVYIFSLFYAIITNYYMGYMICIFSLLYFIYYILCNFNLKKDRSKIIKLFKDFMICSILSVGLSLFLLIPTIFELAKITKSDISPFLKGIKVENPLTVLSCLFMVARGEYSILSKNIYSLYFGTMNLILLFFYFMNKSISKKEKWASLGIIMIFISSIFINYIDYIWHGFTETSSFPARYLFLFSFFCISLCPKSIERIQNVKKEKYLVFLVLFLLVSIITMIGRYNYISNYILIINNILVVFYLILLYYLPKLPIKKMLIIILIVILNFCELFFNFYMSIRNYNYFSRYEIEDIYNNFNHKIVKIKKKDDDFYRIEKNYQITVNDSFRYDINSAAHFLSTINKKTLSFLGYTSYRVGNNYAVYFKANPVIDSILGNKYVFAEKTGIDEYELIDKMEISDLRFEFYNQSKSPVYIYKNPYAFSLGTLVSNDTGKGTLNYNEKKLDRLKFQNDMVNCLSGSNSNVFEKVELEKIDKNKYKIFITGKKTLYLVPKISFNYNKASNKVSLTVNGQKLYDYDEASVVISNFAVNSDDGVEVTIELKNDDAPNKEYELYAYYFNYDEYERIFKDLSSEKMKILKNSNGYIKGEVEVKDNKKNYLFLNTEYTDEWEIKVDGKKAQYDEVFNTFVGVKLKKGKHTIEMKFHPKGFKLGVVLSIISFILTIYYLKNQKNIEG